MATLRQILQANNYVDLEEEEPWNVGDGETILLNDGSGDSLQLADDGVAVWNNSDGRWYEFDPSWFECWVRGDRFNLEQSYTVLNWMRDFWHDHGLNMRDAIERIADFARNYLDDVVISKHPEVAEMPPEIAADFMEDIGDVETAELYRVYAQTFPSRSVKQEEVSDSPKESNPYHRQHEEIQNYKPPEPEEKSLRMKYKTLRRYYH